MSGRLGDVAAFIRGITFKPEDVVPVGTPGTVACMRTKNVQTELDLSDVWGVADALVKRDDQYLHEGDILVSSANSWNLVGKCCWIPPIPWRASFGGFVSVLRADPSRIDPRYLFHWFGSGRIQATVRSFGQQTTNISNLNIERCLNQSLPLPPLPEQRRIAEVLDRAEALRAKRRAALAQLDTLTQSIFLDMFGDPVANTRSWPTKKLSSLGSLDRGVSKHRPRNAPELLGGSHPFVQTGDVANSNGYIRTFTGTYSDAGLRQSRMWPAGTLCITIAANIAKTGILTFEACFPDSVVGFRADDPATVEFVRSWLSFLQASLEENAPESAQKNINLEILRGLDVPTPEIGLQQVFAGRVAAVERLKASHRASLTELDTLFSSLQHRAFRGEL
ncbi:MAG: restriction endonuclease subunit S [Acidobacteria bacterium]|nr:restriction endonuclease subunit S [Acidobacteriota bacterium]